MLVCIKMFFLIFNGFKRWVFKIKIIIMYLGFKIYVKKCMIKILKWEKMEVCVSFMFYIWGDLILF